MEAEIIESTPKLSQEELDRRLEAVIRNLKDDLEEATECDTRFLLIVIDKNSGNAKISSNFTSKSSDNASILRSLAESIEAHVNDDPENENGTPLI